MVVSVILHVNYDFISTHELNYGLVKVPLFFIMSNLT